MHSFGMPIDTTLRSNLLNKQNHKLKGYVTTSQHALMLFYWLVRFFNDFLDYLVDMEDYFVLYETMMFGWRQSEINNTTKTYKHGF